MVSLYLTHLALFNSIDLSKYYDNNNSITADLQVLQESVTICTRKKVNVRRLNSRVWFSVFFIRIEDKVFITKLNGINSVYPVNRSTQKLMSSLGATCSSGEMTIRASVSHSRTSRHEVHD